MDQNPLSSYREILDELSKTHPKLSALLNRADRNRKERLGQYKAGRRVRGLEELLCHLEIVFKAFQSSVVLSPIAFLIERALGEFETAIEATFSGMYSVVGDSMRGIMEIEFLLREFYHEPQNMETWLKSDDKIRREKFQPYQLRSRQALRLGQQPSAMRDHKDYKAHSVFLHVTPIVPIMHKGVSLKDELPWQGDMCFWEMFEHGRRLVNIIHELLVKYPSDSGLNPHPEDLSDLKDAWVGTQEMQSMWQSIIDAAREEASDE